MQQATNLPETGPELKQLRTDAGVQLQDMADALGIDYSDLSRIENRRRRMPEGLPERYRTKVREIFEERREKVLAGTGQAQ